ncbi:MAG: hypothetical protein IPH54_11600 [Rhodoferax sp.]|nr:hypothetical protein [Rhodoferax sp.]
MLPSTTPHLRRHPLGSTNPNCGPCVPLSGALAPIVIALLVATGWILAANRGELLLHWRLWLLTTLAALLVMAQTAFAVDARHRGIAQGLGLGLAIGPTGFFVETVACPLSVTA